MEKMRRSERQVTDTAEIQKVMDACDVCRLGLWDGEAVYVVPLNFGYVQKEGGYTLYFHSAQAGRKVELLRRGGKTGFEMDCAHRLVSNDQEACKYTMMYKSVIGVGRPREVPEKERAEAIRVVMAHYTDNKDLTYKPEMIARITIFALDVEELTCKEHQ